LTSTFNAANGNAFVSELDGFSFAVVLETLSTSEDISMTSVITYTTD